MGNIQPDVLSSGKGHRRYEIFVKEIVKLGSQTDYWVFKRMCSTQIFQNEQYKKNEQGIPARSFCVFQYMKFLIQKMMQTLMTDVNKNSARPIYVGSDGICNKPKLMAADVRHAS